MSEAFWLGGVTTSLVVDASPQAGLSRILRELCQATHYPASAVEQVTWFSSQADAETLLPVLNSGGFELASVLCLPAIPKLVHQQLQAASQAILAGDRNSILLGITTHSAISAILLCSPEAAGKLNLLPKARIAGRYTARPDRFDPEVLVRAAQMETEEEFKKVFWCGNIGLQTTFPIYFEKLEEIPDPISGLISLYAVLKDQPASLGLLLTGSAGAVQATAMQSI